MEDPVSFVPNASGKKSRYRKLEGKFSDLSKRIRDDDKILALFYAKEFRKTLSKHVVVLT